MMQFPHCDAKVLHAPEDGCTYCNGHPDWQELRTIWGINFTGHSEPGFIKCPAEQGRPLEIIERWHGNVPMTPEQTHMDEEYWAEINATYANHEWETPATKEPSWIKRIFTTGS
jgi:hypothetical protein